MAVYAKRATVALALGAATTYFQHCNNTCDEDEHVPSIKKGPPIPLKGAWSDLFAALHDPDTIEDAREKYLELKDDFDDCDWTTFSPSNITLAHRGDALNLAEHTKAAYRAAARQGAKWLECDMTRTKLQNGAQDFVCRHSTEDLSTTTNIVDKHFQLAQKNCKNKTNAAGDAVTEFTCSTKDFTLVELKTLTAMMDSAKNPDWDETNKGTHSYLLHQRKYRTSFQAYQGMPKDLKIVTLEEYLEFALANKMNVAPEIKDTHVLDWSTAKGIVDRNLAKIKAFMDSNDDAKDAWKDEDSIILQTFDWRLAHYLATEDVRNDSEFEYRVQYMWEEEPRDEDCTRNDSAPGGWVFPPEECCFKKTLNDNEFEYIKKDCGHKSILDYLLEDGAKVDIFAPPIQRWITSDGAHLNFKKAKTGKMLSEMKNSTQGAHLQFGTFSFEREGCWEPGTRTYLTLAPCPERNPDKEFYFEGISGVSAKRNADTLFIMKWLFETYGDAFIGAFSDYPFTLAALHHCVLSKATVGRRLRQLL